jgi:hypothetical protein
MSSLSDSSSLVLFWMLNKESIRRWESWFGRIIDSIEPVPTRSKGLFQHHWRQRGGHPTKCLRPHDSGGMARAWRYTIRPQGEVLEYHKCVNKSMGASSATRLGCSNKRPENWTRIVRLTISRSSGNIDMNFLKILCYPINCATTTTNTRLQIKQCIRYL